uniref:Uncharacterized protein n=1 Tax=Oncorhynchus mykiss TaxID=8022 RepID=A0A8C7PBV8_ONCMY
MLWCSIPGCANFKQVQAAGWLAAVLNLMEKYPSVYVGCQHFQPEDFETDLKTLKCEAIPSICTFTSKRKHADQPTSAQQKISQAAVM